MLVFTVLAVRLWFLNPIWTKLPHIKKKPRSYSVNTRAENRQATVKTFALKTWIGWNIVDSNEILDLSRVTVKFRYKGLSDAFRYRKNPISVQKIEIVSPALGL